MWLFLIVSWVGLQHVIGVFPDHTRLLFGALFLEECSAYVCILFSLFFVFSDKTITLKWVWRPLMIRNIYDSS